MTTRRNKIDLDVLKSLWLSNVRTKEIATKLNTSRYTVRYWAKKMGLPNRKILRRINLEALKELASMGLSNVEISRRLGVSRHTVKYWRKKLGLKAKYRKMSIDDLLKVRDLYLDGWALKDIAMQTGWSIAAIYKGLKKLGVKKRPKSVKVQRIDGTVEKLDGITYVKTSWYDWYKLWLDEAIEAVKLLETYTPYYDFLLGGDWYDNICAEIKENLPSVRKRVEMLRDKLARQIKILKIENETSNC